MVHTFHTTHELSNEQECGWGSDIGRVNGTEILEFIVERKSDFGGKAFYDEGVKAGGERDVVEVLGVVKLLHHL